MSTAKAAESKVEVIDRVVATVDSQIILLSELRQRAAPMLSMLFSSPDVSDRMAKVKELYRNLLNRAIEDILIAQAAKQMGLSVSRDEVDRAVQDVMQRNQMEPDQFWEAVDSQGLTEAQYRQDIRKQLLRYRVINQRVRTRINITEEDVRRDYNREARHEDRQFRFKVSHVLFAVEEDASPAVLAEARQKASEVRRTLSKETFQEAVDANAGGSLGWLSQGDLPESLATPLLSMSPGDISQPIRGPGGFHILWLEEREKGSEQSSYEARKQQIYQGLLEKALAEQEKVFLRELKRKAVIKKML